MTKTRGAGAASGGATQHDSGPGQVHWDPDVSYGAYLHLETLLSCQHRRSPEHDEMLFIIIHQASELWLKLCVFEVQAAISCIAAGDVGPALKMLARVTRIQAQLTQSWSILSTLTPADYGRFRGALGQSSGFQSWQYRHLEFLLGNKNPELVRVHARTPAGRQPLESALHQPSLYDIVLRRMHALGFDVPAAVLQRDWSQPYSANAQVHACWRKVYESPEAHWGLYELAEKLVDVEHQFQRWRFEHMKTVERIIGRKRGTGGTSGVEYLARALDLRFFPELWDVRTEL